MVIKWIEEVGGLIYSISCVLEIIIDIVSAYVTINITKLHYEWNYLILTKQPIIGSKLQSEVLSIFKKCVLEFDCVISTILGTGDRNDAQDNFHIIIDHVRTTSSN